LPHEILNLRLYLLGFISALHGVYRVMAFHPFYNSQYRKWLCITPWSWDKPLPQGPVHLIWTDALTLGVLSLLAYSNIPELSAVPIVAFLAAYLVLVNVTLQGELVLTLLFAPLVVYPLADVFFAGFVLVGLYVIARMGLHRYFKDFPWSTDYWKADLIEEMRKNAIRQNVIGWPFKFLRIFDAPGVSVRTALCVSLMAVWWVHVLCWWAGESSDLGLLAFGGAALAIFRTAIYAGSYRPPVNLFGRVATGRLIIPRYDKIFVAPVCIVLAATLLPAALSAAGLDKAWAFKGSIFLVLFLTLALPPALKSWALTGAHRVGRQAQSVRPRQPSPQDQKIGEFFSERLKAAR
jgi:hypothetical protein